MMIAFPKYQDLDAVYVKNFDTVLYMDVVIINLSTEMFSRLSSKIKFLVTNSDNEC